MYEELISRLLSLSEIDAIQQEPGVCRITMECIGAIKEIAIEAADAIEELSQAKEELAKQIAYWQAQLTRAMCGETLADLEKSQWVSVTERLPEVDLKVLTFARFKGDGSWFMDISSFSGVTNHGIPTFWGYGEEMVVTHWQPLPEPPKEENDED